MSQTGELWLSDGGKQQLEAYGFCRRVQDGYIRHTGSPLSPEDMDDQLSYLVAVAWQISANYDPGRGVPFGVYLHGILSRRANDWLRDHVGRTKWQWSTHSYERERPLAPLSLDAPTGDTDSRVLGDMVAAPTGGDAADSEQTFRWLDDTRHSQRARDLGVLRQWLLEESAA